MNTLATPGIIIIERDVLRPTFNSKVESEIGRPSGEVEIIIGGKSYYTPINPVDGS
ncbi:hypothetical protein [Duffyella gerundensis]|uniref:hypothetical protein n=1 Tax=Duffyella gerundensis TaxID=1619313 RepID=UPI0021F7E216|nr:hypothetical protein [Duffyella gerundensis]